MDILVIGAEGQVGGFLMSELQARHRLTGTSQAGVADLPTLDIRDAQAVRRYLEQVRPNHVILTAALTHVDRCEEIPAEAEAINVRGAENDAKACRAVDAGMTFFSSEYVFDGTAGPYGEADKPHPESVYGRTKLEGEQAVAALVSDHLIVRTTVVFSYLPGSMNFFMQLLSRSRKGEIMTVPSDQIGNPTQAVNLARAVGELIERRQTGVFNLVGTTWIGRADFAREVVRKLGRDPGLVKPVLTSELKQKAARPLTGGLKTDKAQSVLQTNKLWDLNTAIDFTLSQIKTASGVE